MAEDRGLPPVDRKVLAAYLRGLSDEHTKAIGQRRNWLEGLPWWRKLDARASQRECDEFNRGAAINLDSVARFVETGEDSRTRRSVRAQMMDFRDMVRAYMAEHGAGCQCGLCLKSAVLFDERD